MRRVSEPLANYLLDRWKAECGGLSHAAAVFFLLEKTEQEAYLGRQEIICFGKNGIATIGVLDKEGKVLYVAQETEAWALKRGLPFWEYESLGISPVLLLRLDAGLTQTALAKLAGCTQKDVSRWETGARNPTEKSMERLRKAVQKTST